MDGDADLLPWFAMTQQEIDSTRGLQRFYHEKIQFWFFPLALALNGINMSRFNLTKPIFRERCPERSVHDHLEDHTPGELREAAGRSGLTKFFDVNLTQLLRDDPLRDTLEVRILPGAMNAADVIERAAIIEALLDRCLDLQPFPAPPGDPVEAERELSRLAR